MPRHDSDEGPETPEALFLSGLIDAGIFSPASYNITEDELSCWEKLFVFGCDVQERDGRAPSLEIVKLKFPEFPYSPGVPVGWAAGELHRAAAKRRLRGKGHELIKAINDDDLDKAYSLFEGIQRPYSVRKAANSLWDYTTVEDRVDVSKIAVPWPTLMRATGGIAPAELWYLGGRPGQGKSYLLCLMAAWAALEGHTVRYVSAEMSTSQINWRVLRALAGTFKTDGLGPRWVKDLDSMDRERMKRVMDEMKERVEGKVEVLDSSHGRITNSFVRDQLSEGDLVMVDHVGLMWTTDGRKAVDDWRALATISNVLREDTIATGTPIVAASQLNREADSGFKAPKVKNFAGSDAIGQDGNVAITMRRRSEHCSLLSAEKVREGPGMKWHIKYDPANAVFTELSHDAANELIADDGDYHEDE